MYNAEKTVKLIEDGEYEVVISEMSLKPSKNDTETLKITYKIRDDVEQTNKNRLVFENIWLGSEFHKKKINNLLYCVEAPKDQEFNNIKDVITYCTGKKVIAKIIKKVDDYYGDERNFVQFIKPSLHKDQQIELDTIDVSDSDLPF